MYKSQWYGSFAGNCKVAQFGSSQLLFWRFRNAKFMLYLGQDNGEHLEWSVTPCLWDSNSRLGQEWWDWRTCVLREEGTCDALWDERDSTFYRCHNQEERKSRLHSVYSEISFLLTQGHVGWCLPTGLSRCVMWGHAAQRQSLGPSASQHWFC